MPVVVIDRAPSSVPLAEALCAGGLKIIEVTLRTPDALEAISLIAENVPDALVGAGTVLNDRQVESAVSAGARFIVSPGLHESVVEAAKRRDCPVFPGVATATEALSAWNMGLRTLKFFPAEKAGGVGMLKALAAVFRDIMFMPTGGITPANLQDYLQLPSVIACGGSWLTPSQLIKAGDFSSITRLAREAREIAEKTRG